MSDSDTLLGVTEIFTYKRVFLKLEFESIFFVCMCICVRAECVSLFLPAL